MATKPTITRITDTFTDLTNNVNTISLDLGATGRLTTNEDSDAVSAINELELGLRGTSNNLVATDLAAYGITANNVVSALKELDSDIHGGGGGNVKGDLTYTSYSQGSGNKSVVGAINAIDAFIGHDSAQLPTTAKTIINAIKELDSDLHGVGGGNAKADLNTDANDVVSAINEIEAVFDASANEITAPDDFSIIATGHVTVDALGDIILDVDGSDVLLKNDSVDFGAFTDSGSNLVIKSGTTTAIKLSGANATLKGTLNVNGATDLDGTLNVDGNTTLNGNVTLGNANTDNVVFSGDVNSRIVPNTDDTYDLGDSAQQWRNLYIDGTAFIDNLDADSAEIGDVNIFGSTITAPTNITVDVSGDIILDADNGNIDFKDAAATKFAFGMGATQTLDITQSFKQTTGSNWTDSASGARYINSTGALSSTASSITATSRGAQTLRADSGLFTIVASDDVNVTAGGNQFRLKNNTGDRIVYNFGTNQEIDVTGSLTYDVEGDITFDANGGDIFLKDSGVQFGALTNSSGNLVIKSGSTTVMTGDSSDASVTFAGKINPPSLSTAAQDVAGAINELNDSIGSGGLNTTASTLIGAINEHETDIGNMTFTGLTSTNISAAIRELRTDIGDVTAGNMGTTASNLTAAVFELEQEIDTLNTKVEPAQALTTTATTLSDAVNELDGEIGDSAMGTVATTVKGAIYEHEQLINTLNDSVGAGGLHTLAQTLIGGINELNDSIGSGGLNTTAQTLIGAINENDTLLGDSALGTVKATVTGAIAEHEVQINNLDSDIGTRSSLTTNNKTNLVAAINEHDTEIGSASLNTSATTLRGAINELHAEIGTTVDSDGRNGNLSSANIGQSLYLLDSAIGDISALSDTDITDTKNLVTSINSVAADVAQLTGTDSDFNDTIGSLANLDAAFVGAERNSIINAINALRADIPLIYDENGTQLN